MRFKRIEIAVNILFWVIVTWFVVSKARIVGSVEMIDGKPNITYVRSYERMFVFFLAQVFFISFFYLELYLINRLKKPKAIKGFIIKSLLLFIGTPILYEFLVQKVIFPDSEISENLGRLTGTIILYLTIAIFYGFAKKWIKQEQEKIQLELTKQQVELNLLRQQLQPHFLFNTMNNLLAMVNQNENPKLAQGIDKLSNLLRYVVYDLQQGKVTIAQEISFIHNFVELHLLRFEVHEIDFQFNIQGSFDKQYIEPGIFLCYIENAFKHGGQPEEEAFIHIEINISKKDTIHFKIENSIPEARLEKGEGGFGIKANQERLDLIYPEKHHLIIDEGKTYKIELIINT